MTCHCVQQADGRIVNMCVAHAAMVNYYIELATANTELRMRQEALARSVAPVPIADAIAKS